MSKAEERARDAYPPTFIDFNRKAKRIQSNKVDTHAPVRNIYIKGYHQAEKDLELTWEDIRRIYLLVISVSDMQGWKGTDKSIYQEVLKRFNGKKGRNDYGNN